jgi:hypothetical protein
LHKGKDFQRESPKRKPEISGATEAAKFLSNRFRFPAAKPQEENAADAK